MRLGFIGLGLMGGPMCANLMTKGSDEIRVFDVDAAACDGPVERGCLRAACAAEIGWSCDVVFTMVPKNEHVRSLYEELLPAAREGQVLVDMSTIAPDVSRAIAAQVARRGGAMLDAPVVKSRSAAVAGQLGIYAGGPRDAFEKVLPLLRRMGSRVLYLGENGNGLVMKLCHNALVAQIQNGVNETMALARAAAGIDLLTFADAVSMGGGQNFYLDSKAQAIAKRDFTTAFSVENMDKDIHLAQALAQGLGEEKPGIDLTAARYETAMEKGLGRQDFSAVYLLQERE
jgi:3-hydroxyisobutyrate dehydrogenase